MQSKRLIVSYIKVQNKTVLIRIKEASGLYTAGEVFISKNNWGTIDTQYLFGFIYVSSIPEDYFQFNGQLYIAQSCIKKPFQYASTKNININSKSIELQGILNIKTQGALQCKVQHIQIKPEDTNTSYPITRLFIQRDAQQTYYEFNQIYSREDSKVLSINGFTGDTLHITTYLQQLKDQNNQVQDNDQVFYSLKYDSVDDLQYVHIDQAVNKDNTYQNIIYIDSGQNFPTCNKQKRAQQVQ